MIKEAVASFTAIMISFMCSGAVSVTASRDYVDKRTRVDSVTNNEQEIVGYTVGTNITKVFASTGYVNKVVSKSEPGNYSVVSNAAMSAYSNLVEFASTGSVKRVSDGTNIIKPDRSVLKVNGGETNNVGTLALSSEIPTTTSQLTNNSGFITTAAIPTKVSSLQNDSGYITTASIPTKVSSFQNDSGYITTAAIPTKVSSFQNDSGYITSSDIPPIPTKTSQLTNNSGFITTAAIPTKVSSFQNDAGYITSGDVPGAIDIVPPSTNAPNGSAADALATGNAFYKGFTEWKFAIPPSSHVEPSYLTIMETGVAGTLETAYILYEGSSLLEAVITNSYSTSIMFPSGILASRLLVRPTHTSQLVNDGQPGGIGLPYITSADLYHIGSTDKLSDMTNIIDAAGNIWVISYGVGQPESTTRGAVWVGYSETYASAEFSLNGTNFMQGVSYLPENWESFTFRKDEAYSYDSETYETVLLSEDVTFTRGMIVTGTNLVGRIAREGDMNSMSNHFEKSINSIGYITDGNYKIDASRNVYQIVNVWDDTESGNVFSNGISIFPSEYGDAMRGYLTYDPNAKEYIGETGCGWFYNGSDSSGTPDGVFDGDEDATVLNGGQFVRRPPVYVGKLALTNDLSASDYIMDGTNKIDAAGNVYSNGTHIGRVALTNDIPNSYEVRSDAITDGTNIIDSEKNVWRLSRILSQWRSSTEGVTFSGWTEEDSSYGIWYLTFKVNGDAAGTSYVGDPGERTNVTIHSGDWFYESSYDPGQFDVAFFRDVIGVETNFVGRLAMTNEIAAGVVVTNESGTLLLSSRRLRIAPNSHDGSFDVDSAEVVIGGYAEGVGRSSGARLVVGETDNGQVFGGGIIVNGKAYPSDTDKVEIYGGTYDDNWDGTLPPMIIIGGTNGVEITGYDSYNDTPPTIKIGGTNIVSKIPTRTSQLTNDGDDGTNKFATVNLIDASNETFSNAVLSVGLGIDTNTVAAINALVEQGDGLPIGGATTVGVLLLALAAAIAALKRKKADRVTTQNPNGNLAKLDQDGNLADSGVPATSVLTSVPTATSGSVGGVKVNGNGLQIADGVIKVYCGDNLSIGNDGKLNAAGGGGGSSGHNVKIDVDGSAYHGTVTINGSLVVDGQWNGLKVNNNQIGTRDMVFSGVESVTCNFPHDGYYSNSSTMNGSPCSSGTYQITHDGYIHISVSDCLSPDTSITMSDGSTKCITDVKVGDRILTPLGEDVIVEVSSGSGDAIDSWEFDDGTIINTVGRHRFFNCELNEPMYLEAWKIGEHALRSDGVKIKLVSHVRKDTPYPHATLFTEKYNLYYANGLLSGNRRSVGYKEIKL